MNKKSKIVLIGLLVIVGIIYAGFLFVLPNFVDLNAFKPQIQKAVKEATGLEVDPGKLKLATYPDFSINLTTENPKVDKYMTVEKASIRVLLPALIFKKLEIEEVKVEKPEIFLTRLKNGKYDIENAIVAVQPPTQPGKAVNKTEPEQNAVSEGKPSGPSIEPVLKGMKLYVSDYKVNLKDKSTNTERDFVLKGDLLEITKFQPDEFIKLATNGTLLVGNEPNINFDIKLESELPLVEQAVQQKAGDKQAGTKGNKAPQKTAGKQVKPVDPIAKILKYDPKVDIVADLKLKKRKTLPEIKGKLNFSKLSIIVDGQKLPESSGQFIFSGKKINLDSKLFITTDSYFELAGKVNDLAKQDFDINVKSSDINLKDVKKFAYSLADAANADVSTLKDINLSGLVKADFNLKKDNYDGYLNVIDTTISHAGLSEPLKNLNSTLNFNKTNVVFEETSGQIGDIGFDVTGNINSDLISDIKISLPDINLKTVYNIANKSALLADLKPQLKDIAALNGSIRADILLNGKLDENLKPIVKAWIKGISAYYVPSQMPISVTGGNISIDKDGKIQFKNILTNAANMPLDITGQFEGEPDNWKLAAATDINNIEYLTGKNTLKIYANGNTKTVSINESGLFAGDRKVVSINGNIENGTDLKDIKVDISGLNVNIPEPKGLAQLNGNLVVTGKADAPKALGTIKLTNLDIPSLQFKTNDIAIGLKQDAITLNTGVLSIVDSKIKLDADIENKLTPPYVVRSLAVESIYLNLDNLTKALEQQQAAQKAQSSPSPSQGQGAGLKAQNTSSTAVANAGQEADIPLVINSGKFSARELIVNKLQNNDVSFDFTLTPPNKTQAPSNLAIRNFVTHIAGGTVVGRADMNIKTNWLGVDVTADNVEINALATTLANMPNEIFGGMDGKIKLQTIGKTPEAMIENAVGRADFNIVDGHLGKLADLGYLLKAISIKNMESLNTNQFDKLDGQVLINRGTLDVQHITMQGKRMSSYITGSIRMKDNHADLTVLSKLHGKIVKQLGFIADISVNKLAEQIPGKWGKLLGEFAAEARLSNQYPDRDKIPSLNEETSVEQPNKDFAVKIKGVLGEPGSVRMLEWLE